MTDFKKKEKLPKGSTPDNAAQDKKTVQATSYADPLGGLMARMRTDPMPSDASMEPTFDPLGGPDPKQRKKKSYFL